MPSNDSSIPPSGIAGRIGKFVVGAIQVYYASFFIAHFRALTTPSLHRGLWLFVVTGLWLIPFIFNLGFVRLRRDGRRFLWVVLAVTLILVVWDARTRSLPWGPSSASWILAVTIYAHLHVGLSHIFSSISGLRGCEMRVIPYYLSRFLKRPGSPILALCPGMWTPLDRWEAEKRGLDD